MPNTLQIQIVGAVYEQDHEHTNGIATAHSCIPNNSVDGLQWAFPQGIMSTPARTASLTAAQFVATIARPILI
jgi:hypothetical protein